MQAKSKLFTFAIENHHIISTQMTLYLPFEFESREIRESIIR